MACFLKIGEANALGSKLAPFFGSPLAKYEPPHVWLLVLRKNSSRPKLDLGRACCFTTTTCCGNQKQPLISIFSAAFAMWFFSLVNSQRLRYQTNWTNRWFQRNFRSQLLAFGAKVAHSKSKHRKIGIPNLYSYNAIGVGLITLVAS